MSFPDKVFNSAIFRLGISLLAIAGLSLLILTSAKFGFSRLLQRYAVGVDSPATKAQAVAAINYATSLTPDDPEAHRMRAALLSRFQLYQYARPEQEIAVQLRPKDDRLWLELGNIEEELEDSQNALLSYNEAVRNAPYYAHTRWQRGNLLLRMGQHDEAFNDLRAATKSNRIFVPNFIDLAWALAGKNVNTTESILQIEDDYTRLAFAKFLARNGEGAAALDQLKAVSISVPIAVKKEIISRLLGSKSYKAAFELSNSLSGKSENGATQISDGGFETKITFDDHGVSWQIPAGQSNVTMAQDSTVKESGANSLRITFSGNSTPGVHLLSETVLASPEKRYRINFEFRVQNLVTGGPPQLVVSDACNDEVLGRLVLPAQSDNEWHSLSFDFSTKQNCDAIVLHLSRISCTTTPCPIFGVLWLDSFSIQELPK